MLWRSTPAVRLLRFFLDDLYAVIQAAQPRHGIFGLQPDDVDHRTRIDVPRSVGDVKRDRIAGAQGIADFGRGADDLVGLDIGVVDMLGEYAQARSSNCFLASRDFQ